MGSKQLALNMDGQLSLSIPTALGPGDPDDGEVGRQQRGLTIAALVSVSKNRLGYKIPSQSGPGSYIVNVDGTPFCSCPDFELRQEPCKHIYAVEFIIQREEREDGSTIETQAVRMTYGQHWAAYNGAQTNEQDMFGKLLRELCDTVPQPLQGKGRPRLPLSDMLFGIGLKIYSTLSTRRAMTAVRNAHTDGLISKAPSFTSMFRGTWKTPALRLSSST